MKKSKKTIGVMVLFCIYTKLSLAQNVAHQGHNMNDYNQKNDSEYVKPDTFDNRSLKFGKEKAGSVCVNGLEKLEVAGSSDKGLLFVNQLHFYAPWILEGRLFMQAEQERTEKTPVHFFDATVDLTVREFPLHLGYTMGLDQLGKKPNTTYSGPAATIYWSDLRSVHKIFHIFRTGISYVTLSEHLQSSKYEDSTVSRGKELEANLFFQFQPFHVTHNLSVFSEGLFRMRGQNSFGELEIGVRHQKVLEDLVGFGVRLGFEDLHFHSLSGFVRFNISNPNPKHDINRVKPKASI